MTGFEDGAALTPSSSVTSSGVVDDTEVARTGSKCWKLEYGSLRYGEGLSINSVQYVHIIAWAKGSGSVCVSAYGGNNKNPNTTLTNVYQRVTHSDTHKSSTAGRLYSQDAAPVYWDDVVYYTDNNADVDLTAPSSATNLSASATELTWTNGSDALTGVQATLVFYNPNPDAIGLTLNDQGIYSLTSTLGPKKDQSGNWTLLKEDINPSATSYSGSLNQGTYAVVHRDLAYNYSTPAYVTLGAACVPPTITTQPASATYSQGASASALTVEASGTSLTYQWQESSDNSNWTNIANEITASYTPSTSATGTKYYRCVVTESNDCFTNSNVATITVNAATSFTAGQTIFARSSGKGAWEADACVKAEFSDNSWGNKKEVAMVWLYNVGDTYKMFYFIVPSDNTYNHVQLNRYDPDGCTSKWNTVEWFGVDGSKNTIHSTTASSSNQGSWYSTNYEMYLKGSIDWGPNLATFTDQLNGDFAATYNNFQPSATSYDFRVYDINDQAFGNSNTTLSGLIVGSTYNITASFNIGSRGTLILGKEFVKGTVSFNANGHGTAPTQLTDVPANSKLTEPEVEEVLGYTLEGWYTESACTNKWNFETDVVTESMTLYAHWVPTQYTITYNGLEGASNPNNPTTYTIESATITFQAPGTRTGYNFASWSPASIPAGSTGDKSTTASWTSKTTAITLDANTANHGEGANSGVTATYDNATLPAFTACTGKTGYTLTGYWTNGTGGLQVIDASGSLVANVSGYTDEAGKWKREDASLTLYAQYARVTSVTAEWGYNNSSTCLGEFPSESSNTKNGITITTNGVTHNINHAKNVTSSPATYGIQINSISKYVDITIPSNTTFKTVYTSNTVVNQFEIVFCSTSAFNSENIVKTVNLTGNTPSNSTDQVIDKITEIPSTAKMARIRTRSGVTQSANADLYYLKVEATAPEEPTDVYAITGQFKGDAGWVDRALENGQVTLTLDKETSYPFKVKKTPQGSSEFTWYTDTNEGEMTENNHDGWVFNKTNGNNTRLLTAAAGQYTISVNTGGEYPVVSVSYPTSYTVSFVANGGTGTMNPVKHFAPNDSYTIPDCGFTYANMHFTGWKDQNEVSHAVGEEITITSHLTLTAQWEKAVTGLTISAEGDVTELLFGQQCQMTANIEPADATYGTDISWTVVDDRYGSITAGGLFTASTTNAGTATIKATSGNGVEATYNMEITSGDCSDWFILAWKNGQDKNRDGATNCFTQVGETDEWRCDYILPNGADWFYVAKMGGGDHPEDWTFSGITTIGLQSNKDATNYYPGQDAEGYLRIYASSGEKNSYIAFQPIYVAMYNTGSEWRQIEFENTSGNEYESSVFQVPVGYKTNNNQYYVGTKRNGTTNTPFVDGKSHTDYLKDVGGLSDADMGGKYGKFHIYDNSSANNWYCQFIRYYQLSYSGEGTEDYNPQYVKSSADDKTITLGQVPAKTGYSPNGWLINSTHYDAGASYTLTDDAVAVAQWTPNPYSLTLAAGEHGSSAGSATATYDATVLTTFNAVTPADGYTVTGYYSGATKVLNADGTFAATNIDGFITSGKWTKAENCTLTAHYSISTTTITIDPNGGTVGSTSVTATYGQPLPSFDPCQAPQTKILVGYTVGGNLIINRDGTLVPNTDYADANGKWTFTGSALTVLASYRDAEEICKTFCEGGDISANGTYHYNDFTIETNITNYNTNRGTLGSGKYIIITNPNGFSTSAEILIHVDGYSDGNKLKYTYSPNTDGSSSGYATVELINGYKNYYINLPQNQVTRYIKFERGASDNIGFKNVCIAETGYTSIITVGPNDVRELQPQVDNLVIHEGGQVTNETLTINKSLTYKRTHPGTDTWATISLPFDATYIKVYDTGDREDCDIWPAYGPLGEGEVSGYFFMKELTQSTEEDFQNSWTHIKTKMPEKDKPYIVSFPKKFGYGYFETNTQISYLWRPTPSQQTLTINKIDIPSGPYISKEDGREFILCANPNLMGIWLGEGTTAYLLTDDGTCFDRVDEPVIPPFSAYVIATQDFIAKCPRIMLVGGGSTPTDLVPIYSSPDVRADNRKVLIQGQIYIYRAGQVFDLTGNAIY